MTITEDKILDALLEFFRKCDADELARLAGEIFGGECYPHFDSNCYTFEPNENYFGAFEQKKVEDLK